MIKFELGQTIYYMSDNKMHSAPVLARMIVENRDNGTMFGNQAEMFQPFGEARVVYGTCHGLVNDDEVFESAVALALHITGVDIFRAKQKLAGDHEVTHSWDGPTDR